MALQTLKFKHTINIAHIVWLLSYLHKHILITKYSHKGGGGNIIGFIAYNLSQKRICM
jgi:hypothetical protein